MKKKYKTWFFMLTTILFAYIYAIEYHDRKLIEEVAINLLQDLDNAEDELKDCQTQSGKN